MFFVLEYTQTDGYTYWVDSYLTFKAPDKETAYVTLCDLVQQKLDSLSKDSNLSELFISIQDCEVCLDQLVDSNNKAHVNICSLEEFCNSVEKNSKNLDIKF